MKQRELPKRIYTLVTDEGQLDCMCAYLGIVKFADNVTAALVAVRGGDYEAVYLTEGVDFKRSADWDWHLPEFFADYVP